MPSLKTILWAAIFTASVISAAIFHSAACRYHAEAEAIAARRPTMGSSLAKAFLDGFTLGLTGGGDIFAEAHRLQRDFERIDELKRKRGQARILFGCFAVTGAIALGGTILSFRKKAGK